MSRAFNRVLGLLSWARTVTAKALAGRIGRVQTSAHADDEFDHVQPYGFQSRPLAGAEVVVASMGSHADQRIALIVGDRRYTIALEAGEVAIADDLEQRVHLTRTGIVVEAPSIKLGAAASLGVARATDPVSPASSMATWIAAVSTATGATPPVDFGTIASGSTKTRSE